MQRQFANENPPLSLTFNAFVTEKKNNISFPSIQPTASLQLLLGHIVILLRTLFEEEVGGKLFVLVAREVGLDDLILGEAQTGEALNSIALFLGDGNADRATLTTLAEKVEELVGVLADHLSELRVTSTELLQDRLQHLGLLLHKLTHLLELGIVAQEIEVSETSGLSTGTLRTTSTTTSTSAVAKLSSKIEEVNLVIVVTTGGSGRSGLGSGSRGSSRGGGRLTGGSLLLEVGGDSLKPMSVYQIHHQES